MRSHCLHEVSSRAAFGRMTWAVRGWSNWRMRRTLTLLAKLADHQLVDIGLPRDVLLQLIKLPLAMDISWEVERGHLLEQRYGRVIAAVRLPSKENSALSPVTSPQNWSFTSPGLYKGMPWRLD